MSISPALLVKARAAGDRLSASEHQLELARADYHAFIRRMHLAGAGLREIAEALDISHQRVQQIVHQAGGTWWTRVWRSRNVRRNMSCSFCQKLAGDVAKLIAGPNIFICDSCAIHPPAVASPRSSVRCSFCRRRQSPVYTNTKANICTDCLQVCRQILEDS